jgi:hypothetical protein
MFLVDQHFVMNSRALHSKSSTVCGLFFFLASTSERSSVFVDAAGYRLSRQKRGRSRLFWSCQDHDHARSESNRVVSIAWGKVRSSGNGTLVLFVAMASRNEVRQHTQWSV